MRSNNAMSFKLHEHLLGHNSGLWIFLGIIFGAILITRHVTINPIGALFLCLSLLWLIWCCTSIRIRTPTAFQRTYVRLQAIRSTRPGVFCLLASASCCLLAGIGLHLDGRMLTQLLLLLLMLCYVPAYCKGVPLIMNIACTDANKHRSFLQRQLLDPEEHDDLLLLPADEMPNIDDILLDVTPRMATPLTPQQMDTSNDSDGFDNWSLNSDDEQQIELIDHGARGLQARLNSISQSLLRSAAVTTLNVSQRTSAEHILERELLDCSSDSSDDEFVRGLQFAQSSVSIDTSDGRQHKVIKLLPRLAETADTTPLKTQLTTNELLSDESDFEIVESEDIKL